MRKLKEKVKQEQKQLAQKIRERRPGNLIHSYEFRHRHIIYCSFFNNTPYEKIERPAENNSPNQNLLDKIRNEWEETLRHST